MKVVLILNDPPYGSERGYNGLRLAYSLSNVAPETKVTVFLMSDSVLCAKAGQRPPEGFYNIGKMLQRVIGGGGQVMLCGTCMDTRGITEKDVIEGTVRGTMDALAAITLEADKVLVF